MFESNLFWRVKGDQCPPGQRVRCGPAPGHAPVYGHCDATPPLGSPLIDSAATVAGLDHDFYRNPRPSGSKPDIGAIEVQADGRTRPAPAADSGARPPEVNPK